MNEAMLLSLDGKTAVIFPDLICMLEPDTGRGLMSVELHAGMEIAVLGVPCRPRLREAVQDETGRRSFTPHASAIQSWIITRWKSWLAVSLALITKPIR